MKKNYIITILVACLMATSFVSAEAEENPNSLLLNANHFGKNPNYGANAVFSQYDESSSVMAPKRRKSKRRKGGRRGGDVQQVRFGLELGGNMSNAVISDQYKDLLTIALGTNSEYKLTSGIGFQLGAYVDFNVSELFFVEGGLYVIQRTYNEAMVGVASYPGIPVAIPFTTESTYKPIYLQIPVQVGLNLNISESFAFNVKAGGYLGLGLAGKVSTTAQTEIAGVTTTPEKTEDDFFTDGVNKTDYGLRFGIGAEISKITIGLFMDYSLSNLIKDPFEDMKYSINSFGLNLGYKF